MKDSFILTLNHWADAFGPALWRATWQGGLFVGCIWLICKVFKALPSSARYWLWWIASLQILVRLISVSTLALPIVPTTEPSGVIASSLSATESRVKPLTAKSIGANRVRKEAPAELVSCDLTSKATSQPSRITLVAALLGMWCLGVTACLAVSTRRLFCTRRFLRSSIPIHSGPVVEIVQQFCAEFGMRAPQLLESDAAICPLLAGWRRPAIVLPLNAIQRLGESKVRMALAHEFAHLRRHDLWLGIVPALTQSLFFFHPLAWLATHEGAAAREAACDFEALRTSGGSPAQYARLLLDTAQSQPSMAVLGTAFGYRLIQRRISMLKTITASNPRRLRSATALILALGAICALPWSVTAQNPPPAKSLAAIKAKKALHVRKSAAKVTKKAAHSTQGGATSMPLGLTVRNTPVTQTAPTHAFASVNTPAAAIAAPMPARRSAADYPAAALLPAPIPRTQARSAMTIASASPAVSRDAATTPAANLLPPVRIASPQETEPAVSRDNFAPTRPAERTAGVSEGKCEVSLMNGTTNLHIIFDHVEIHKALKELFFQTRSNFVIKSDVESDFVTMTMDSVSLQVALKKLLGAVKQPLSFELDDDVFQIQGKTK